MTERSIFLAALDMADPAERAAYLEQACGNESALHKHIEELIVAEAKLGGFLARPHAAVELTTDQGPVSERPGSQIGPYKLLEQIGEGGFGVVFMAEQQQPIRRKVALKILKPGMDTRQVIARFEAERQALALMDHPNIARVLDAGETSSGRPYFVMELVKGMPITQFCDEGQLTTRERLELFVSVAQAAQHAHQKGIIHRDIKPTNVLVTLHDGTPVVKVIDFGVAKATGYQLTEKTLFTGFAQMIGTPLYMSPEQAALSGLDIDTRSDIYSLGVLLYELLTGTTPLHSERLKKAAFDEVRRIIREEEAVKPSTRISTLGATATSISALRKTEPRKLSQLLRNELDWIVMKALEKDRTRRYETASAFAADVGRYLRDEQVEACPPSTLYRLKKFGRRNRAALTTGFVFFCSMFILAASMVVVALIARQQRDSARIATRETDAARREAVSERDQAEKARLAESQQRLLAEQRESEAKTARLAEVEQRQQAEQERNNAIAAREELRETVYATDMAQVQAAAESHNFLRMGQLLPLQRPAANESDLRGFEWHYWQRKLKRGWLRTLELPQLRSSVSSMHATKLLSRNAERLAVLINSPEEHTPRAQFGLLTVLDRTGREVLAPFDLFPNERAPGSRMPLLSMNDSGTRLAATISRRPGATDPSPQAPISIRDLGTGDEICRLDSPGIVTELALTADGSQLAVEYIRPRQPEATRRAGVKIWDIATGELGQTLPQLSWTEVHSRILWSPDGTRLLRQSVTSGTGNAERTYRELFQVVNVTSGESIWERAFEPHHALPRRAWAWSPDGKLVVIFELAEHGIAAKNNAQLWNAETGATLAILDRNSPTEAVHNSNIDFSPDGRLLAIASNTNEIYIWELPTLPVGGESPVHVAAPSVTLNTSGTAIQALSFSADGRELYGVDRTSIVAYDATWREDAIVGPRAQPGFGVPVLSSDASKIAFGTGGNGGVWDLNRNRELCQIQNVRMNAFPASADFSADGSRVVFVRNGNSRDVEEAFILVHDAQTGELLVTIVPDRPLESGGTIVTSPVFRPDGRQLAALIRFVVKGEQRTRLLAWDATTGRPTFNAVVDASISAGVRYSRDGGSLIVGSRERGNAAAIFYDANTGERQRSVPLPGASGLFLIDGRNNLFAASVGSEFVLWDLSTGEQWLRLPGYSGAAAYTISPDRSRVVVGDTSRSGESEISVWSPKSNRRLLALKCPGIVRALAFSPDGHRLIGALMPIGAPGARSIQIWDATPLPEEPSK